MADANCMKRKVEHGPGQILQKRPSSDPSPQSSAKKRQCQDEPSQCVRIKSSLSVTSPASAAVTQAKDEETQSYSNCSDTCNKTAATRRKKCKAKRRSQVLQQSVDAKALALTNRSEEDMEIEYSMVVNEVSVGDSNVCLL